jgi:hypothetical protein
MRYADKWELKLADQLIKRIFPCPQFAEGEHRGFLLKQGVGKSFCRRFFVLNRDGLYYYRTSDLLKGKPIGLIRLEDIHSAWHDKQKHHRWFFIVHSSKRDYRLAAASDLERDVRQKVLFPEPRQVKQLVALYCRTG